MRAFNAIQSGMRPVPRAALKPNLRDCRTLPITPSRSLFIHRHGPNSKVSRRYGIPPVSLQKRTFITDGLPSVLVPPTVFMTLLIGLWTYKCIMTVLFQDRIIYMPYMPPFARHEKMEDYIAVCKPVCWEHKHIKSLDGTKLAICVGEAPSSRELCAAEDRVKHVVICYFQGNGSSLPPRLPLLSNVLKAIEVKAAASATPIRYTLVALSYRGYWTSAGRASQRGIELDAQAMLDWVNSTHGTSNSDVEMILWGQSIGAGVASTAAATYIGSKQRHPLTGLILETPFSGIKSMLLALYPQAWLPYKYLWPFLWNHWDSEAALRRIAGSSQKPKILFVPATRDEVVPPEEVNKLENICHDLRLSTERKDVIGALHTEATTRREGQHAVASFVVRCAESR